jgi:hypothetical protein
VIDDCAVVDAVTLLMPLLLIYVVLVRDIVVDVDCVGGWFVYAALLFRYSLFTCCCLFRVIVIYHCYSLLMR